MRDSRVIRVKKDCKGRRNKGLTQVLGHVLLLLFFS